MTDPLPIQQFTPLPEHAPGAILRCDADSIGVLVTHDWRRLIALRRIVAGTKIFTLQGREYAKPTRHSVQIGALLHIDQGHARDANESVRKYPYRFMDHACDPSALVRGRSVVARRDIEPGDAVTFNYNTTEYDMAEPFRCSCESAMCVGIVRGARHLTPNQRALIEDWLADYLR